MVGSGGGAAAAQHGNGAAPGMQGMQRSWAMGREPNGHSQPLFAFPLAQL